MTQKKSVSDSSATLHIDRQIKSLKRSQTRIDRLVNLEIWAIIDSMEEIFPGFWHQFMCNRQVAFKTFLEQKKQKN